MPVWCSVPGCANYKHAQKCVIVHHSTYQRLTPILTVICGYSGSVTKDYQRDFQAELMGNLFRQQLSSSDTIVFYLLCSPFLRPFELRKRPVIKINTFLLHEVQ